MKRLIIFTGTVIFLNFMFFSCQNAGKQAEESGEEAAYMVENEAVAMMSPASGSNVSGKVTFTQVGEKTVNLVMDIEKIAPGKHALHLHEYGDCSADDATSAGGHWNPTNEMHGNRNAGGQYHKGDIDNFTAMDDSTAHFEATIYGWTIGSPDSTNILGKGVIIHAGVDDFTSQPSGAAGARIACGVIQEK